MKRGRGELFSKAFSENGQHGGRNRIPRPNQGCNGFADGLTRLGKDALRHLLCVGIRIGETRKKGLNAGGQRFMIIIGRTAEDITLRVQRGKKNIFLWKMGADKQPGFAFPGKGDMPEGIEHIIADITGACGKILCSAQSGTDGITSQETFIEGGDPQQILFPAAQVRKAAGDLQTHGKACILPASQTAVGNILLPSCQKFVQGFTARADGTGTHDRNPLRQNLTVTVAQVDTGIRKARTLTVHIP